MSGKTKTNVSRVEFRAALDRDLDLRHLKGLRFLAARAYVEMSDGCLYRTAPSGRGAAGQPPQASP